MVRGFYLVSVLLAVSILIGCGEDWEEENAVLKERISELQMDYYELSSGIAINEEENSKLREQMVLLEKQIEGLDSIVSADEAEIALLEAQVDELYTIAFYSEETEEVITAREIQLVDETGQISAVLSGSYEQPRLTFYNRDGAKVFILETTDSGGVFLRVSSTMGNAFLINTDDESVGLMLATTGGDPIKNAVLISVGEKTAYLTFDTNGSTGGMLGIMDNGIPQLGFCNDDRVVSMFSDLSFGRMRVFIVDEDGYVIWSVP